MEIIVSRGRSFLSMWYRSESNADLVDGVNADPAWPALNNNTPLYEFLNIEEIGPQKNSWAVFGMSKYRLLYQSIDTE